MLNKTSKNTGLLVRLIEFSNIQWTESATQSEKIKRVCRENCGFAIYYIAKYLLNTPLDILEREFEEQRKLYLDSSTTKKEFADRISTKYAMLLLTAKIVSKVLKLNLNHKAILDLLVKNESSTFNDIPSNVGERAYESLLEYVSTNKNYFGNGQFAPTIGEIRGVIKPDEIVIPKDKFAKIMKELGFEDTKTIIKNWKDKNLLNCDRDRNTRKRKLTNESCEINCYVIKKDKSTELMPNFMKNMRTEPRKVDTWEEFIK
jgi:hypothetical protein